MSRTKQIGFIILAMLAFAGNSLLSRLALNQTPLDPATFTSVRIFSGALALWLIVRSRGSKQRLPSDWFSAFTLFAYAACFSFAYVTLTTATGALLLFGAVQLTMLSYGLWHGERFLKRQSVGLIAALSGLVGLLLPGLSAPPLLGSLLMLLAGIAWGSYSLRAKGRGDPTSLTAGNFLRASLFAGGLSAITLPWVSLDTMGLLYAALSGALTSGVGYALWYAVLPQLKATRAATVQLSVPVLAALGGIILLGEPLSLRFVIAATTILGGVLLVLLEP